MEKLSDCHILIMDDEEINLSILVDGLKSDYKLNIAKNEESALRIALRTPSDLIMIPGIDGYELCRRLRNKQETAETPIMFLSSLEELQNKVPPICLLHFSAMW